MGQARSVKPFAVACVYFVCDKARRDAYELAQFVRTSNWTHEMRENALYDIQRRVEWLDKEEERALDELVGVPRAE